MASASGAGPWRARKRSSFLRPTRGRRSPTRPTRRSWSTRQRARPCTCCRGGHCATRSCGRTRPRGCRARAATAAEVAAAAVAGVGSALWPSVATGRAPGAPEASAVRREAPGRRRPRQSRPRRWRWCRRYRPGAPVGACPTATRKPPAPSAVTQRRRLGAAAGRRPPPTATARPKGAAVTA
ncbi:hypothetical protein BU14_1196s0001 [Porphyra umbilicalis]|uniref:Uncharacterized protein n=1 Tax=Porphyra umbilicalis TaxID=2786 RepID=A0A1X6NN20_PORUM|nr:hypothetical protein BU14_1196s0001 [Porphyra umbilicalis]|eukprot:OSX69753.1 hypothetical protein BU14_1196s0001 [Porphyra umbilicalis]